MCYVPAQGNSREVVPKLCIGAAPRKKAAETILSPQPSHSEPHLPVRGHLMSVQGTMYPPSSQRPAEGQPCEKVFQRMAVSNQLQRVFSAPRIPMRVKRVLTGGTPGRQAQTRNVPGTSQERPDPGPQGCPGKRSLACAGADCLSWSAPCALCRPLSQRVLIPPVKKVLCLVLGQKQGTVSGRQNTSKVRYLQTAASRCCALCVWLGSGIVTMRSDHHV